MACVLNWCKEILNIFSAVCVDRCVCSFIGIVHVPDPQCVCAHDLVCACLAMFCIKMFRLLVYIPSICIVLGICALYVFKL